MGKSEQKMWLILDEAEKRLLRAKNSTTMADEWYEEVCLALKKVKEAKEKVEKELDI